MMVLTISNACSPGLTVLKPEKGADLLYIHDSPEYERSLWQSAYLWRDTTVVLPDPVKRK
jgi:hypothetical protein